MGHYPRCENAVGRTCVCQQCCGALHGWTDAVDLVRQPDAAGRIAFRAQADGKWTTANARVRKKSTYAMKIAGVDSCRADMIEWLARDRSIDETQRQREISGLSQDLPPESADDLTWSPEPDSTDAESSRQWQEVRDALPPLGDAIVDQVEQTGRDLIGRVLEDIAQEYGGKIPKDVKVALAHHFWCDLLAQFAHVADEGLKLLDSVPDRLCDLVLKSRRDKGWPPITEKVVRIAARSMWRRVRLLTFFGLLKLRTILPVVRMLAVLMCKAPERHRAVVEYCMDPLGKQLLGETKNRLLAALREWLPRMSRGNG
jgi:hypothetical protein